MLLTDYYRSAPDATWEIGRQLGVRHGVIRLPEDPDFDPAERSHWLPVYRRFVDFGIKPVIIEPMPNCLHDHIKAGDEKRDECIERVMRMFLIMEELDIRTVCFNWMAHVGWTRTRSDYPERGGARVTAFDLEDYRPSDKTISAEQLWENYACFLHAVLPEAEKHSIRLALHPDDPPLPKLGEVSRIMISYGAIRHAVRDIVPSENLGVTFCQATFAMMGEDLYDIIPKLADKILFIHFRNAVGDKRCFRETFHDNGSLDMPRLMRLYRDCGLTCATAVQGMLIPPSHNLVIYAVAAGNVSIGVLFLAGFPAGIFLGIVLGIYSYFYARRRGYATGHQFNLKKMGKAFLAAFGGLMTIVIIFCGVSFGIMTATESAAVAALWSFLCAFVFYRTVPLKAYYKIASSAIKTLSTIMILLAIANAFGWVVAYLRIPNKIAAAILALTDNKFVILLLINLVILFLGCIMSIRSILLIITPIVVPILQKLDYSLVQFGIVMILNLGIGLLTPPVGAALYVGSAVSGLGVGKTAKALMPFYLMMVVTLLALAFIPGLTRIFGAW